MKALPVLFLAAAATCAAAQSDTRFQEFQSAKIIQTVDPVFPDALVPTYRHGGQVVILVSIDASGGLADWLAIRYTDPLFAEAAVAAMREWRFEPARVRGEPVPVRIELKFFFEVKGVVVSVSPSELIEASFNELIGGKSYAPCTLRELDRIPVPLRIVNPIYPEELANRDASGEVTVDFYIDERGDVRMPWITGNPHPILADLAADAVRQWKFEPPTRRGQPVLVHVRQLFRFFPPATAKK